MPYLGAHMSIAGGYHHAIEAAVRYGMEACQLFTKNNHQWRARPLTDEDIRRFHDARKQSRLQRLIAHDCYLINLASPTESLYRQSLEAFVVEMQRAEALGIGRRQEAPHVLVTAEAVGKHEGDRALAGQVHLVAFSQSHRPLLRVPRPDAARE